MFTENDNLKNAEIYVVAIEVNEQAVVERISGRFTCSKCLSGYHDKFKLPLVEGKCDICASEEFTRREDDNAETVKNRLQNYYKDTAPIKDFYKEKNLLKEIDGEQEMKKVYEDLTSRLAA